MSENQDHISMMHTQIEILNRDVGTMSNLIVKLDSMIDKLNTVSGSVEKMIVQHEMRLDSHEKSAAKMELETSSFRKDLVINLKELKDETLDRNKQIHDRVDELSKKVEKLEQWRWLIVGISVAAGFILTNIIRFIPFPGK